MAADKKILLGDDGTSISRAARQAAFDLSVNWNAELSILVAGDRSVVEAVELRRKCTEKSVECYVHAVQGDPSWELLEASAALKPDLLILGSHHRHSGNQLGGSVGRAVLLEAAFPVLLVREHAWPPQSIVVGDNGSDEARAAAQLAAEIGACFGASTTLVESLRGDGQGKANRDVIRRESERIAIDAELVGARTHRPATALLSSSPPATALQESVHDAMHKGSVLIAVGSTGRTEFERHMGWSVSTRMIEISSASILIVPRRWIIANQLQPVES
jgi:nucleotide-binding universal stress UspA family protein